MIREGQNVMQVFTGGEILKHVEPGDFVISMRSFQGGLEWCGYSGCVSSAYVGIFTEKEIDPLYFKFLFKSRPYIQALQRTSNLVRDGQALRFQNFAQVRLPLFPLTEQTKIAKFLDYETGRIDALIDKQQQLIELLKEKRQAVISHAVTKGLNPDAPMRDSGVEWLGEVPEHWEVKKASWCFLAEKGSNAQTLTKEYCGQNPGPYPVYSGQTANEGVMGRIDTFEFDFGELGVLFATTVGAKAMHVSHLRGKFSLSQNCLIMKLRNSDFEVRFCFYLISELFRFERMMVSEHMQASFRMEDFYRFPIAQPPQSDQKEIAEYLDREMTRFDKLAKLANCQIELLKERRTALISAAVTGKIDVRDWEPPKEQVVA